MMTSHWHTSLALHKEPGYPSLTGNPSWQVASCVERTASYPGTKFGTHAHRLLPQHLWAPNARPEPLGI